MREYLRRALLVLSLLISIAVLPEPICIYLLIKHPGALLAYLSFSFTLSIVGFLIPIILKQPEFRRAPQQFLRMFSFMPMLPFWGLDPGGMNALISAGLLVYDLIVVAGILLNVRLTRDALVLP